MTLFDDFLCLPCGVVLTILTEWVEGGCLPHLDSAYCSKALRPTWLEILQSPGCILSLIPRNWVDRNRNNIYKFAVSRNVKVSTLCTGAFGPLDLLQRVVHISDHYIAEVHMKWVSESSKPFISNVANRCSNIKVIQLDSCVLYEGFRKLLHNNLHLEKLTLIDCKDISEQPPESFYCPRLNCLSVQGDDWVNKGWLSTMLRGGCGTSLRVIELRVVRISSTISEEAIHTISEMCPNLQRIVFDALQLSGPPVVSLTGKCRHIRVLDLSNTTFPPQGLKQMFRNLHNLHTLRLCYCGMITDEDILLLGTLHGDTLECFSVERSGRAFSEDSMCSFLKRCQRLHTVRLHGSAEWEYSVKTIASLVHLPLTTLVLDAHLSREVKRGIMKNCPQVTVLGLRGENDGGAIVPIVRACKKLKKLYTVGLNAHWQQEMMAVNRNLAIENNYLFPPLVYLD